MSHANWVFPPGALALYGRRIPTRTMHLQQVQAYLGFRKALPLDLYALTLWLVERALEHDKPTLLLQLACDELHRERIVRPGLTRLERLVATARQQAHEETFRQLAPLLTDERKREHGEAGDKRQTPVEWPASCTHHSTPEELSHARQTPTRHVQR